MRRDPVELEIFKNIFHSIAEEMGAALRRTSFSPNIKERRDYSCAVFDGGGEVIAMGDHMPVHLGSMPRSVQAAIADFELAPGDVVMLNDPFRGGTHLPDVTLVAPVFVSKGRRGHPSRIQPDFYVASRAHHADVGGTYPGSMGLCREIYQEGFRIPPVLLMRNGKMERDVLALFLSNVRTPEEREGDLGAQIAACHAGGERLREICRRYGTARVRRAAGELLEYSEELMRVFLQRVPRGTYQAEDFMDNDGISQRPVKIAVKVTFHGTDEQGANKRGDTSNLRGRGRPRHTGNQVTVDFSGSDPQVQGSINAVEAIAYSACFYVFRCLLDEDVPATAGLMRPIRVIVPEGHDCECSSSGGGGGRKCGDGATDCGCAVTGAGEGGAAKDSGGRIGNHEQCDHRGHRSAQRRAIRILRDDCRRHGRAAGEGRCFRRAHAHDEFAEHAGGGAGIRLSSAGAALCATRQ